MHEKSLVFFPRSHNPNLNFMCKSIWDTNYARWKAHTLCSLRLTPPRSITQNLEFSPLGALGMITTIIAQNALTFPYSKETTFEETKASEKWQWSRTGGWKTKHCGTPEAWLGCASQHLCPETAPCSGHGPTVLRTPQLLKITPSKAFGVWTFVPHEPVLWGVWPWALLLFVPCIRSFCMRTPKLPGGLWPLHSLQVHSLQWCLLQGSLIACVFVTREYSAFWNQLLHLKKCSVAFLASSSVFRCSKCFVFPINYSGN